MHCSSKIRSLAARPSSAFRALCGTWSPSQSHQYPSMLPCLMVHCACWAPKSGQRPWRLARRSTWRHSGASRPNQRRISFFSLDCSTRGAGVGRKPTSAPWARSSPLGTGLGTLWCGPRCRSRFRQPHRQGPTGSNWAGTVLRTGNRFGLRGPAESGYCSGP